MITETQPFKSAMAMVCAMAILGVVDNFIVRLAEEIGLWQFHLTRAAVAVPLVVLLSWLGLGRLSPERWWAVALRSGLIAIAMLFYMSALALMSIAQALAGLFTSPMFIILISVIVLRQRIGPWRVVAVVLGFVGILFVLEPDPNDFDIKVLIPVTGGFFYALGSIATRSLCANESTISMLLGILVALGSVGAVGLVVLGIAPLETVPGPDGFVTRGWVWPMWQAAPWVVIQAVGSIAGVFLIIKAYQIGEPSHASVFEYSIMIFGPLFAWVAFGQQITLWQMFGIALIATAGAIIAVRSK